MARHAHRDRRRGELQRVLDQVGHDLRQPVGIGGGEEAFAPVRDHVELHVSVIGGRAKALGRLGHHLGDIGGTHVEGEAASIELRQLEQVAHQALEAARLGGDHCRRLRVVGGLALGDGLGEPSDRRERGAQVV